MNNNQKLTSLANEFKATMNHAEEIFNMYMDAAIEQAVMEAFNELSDVDKVILLLGLMTGAVEDKIIFDLEELLAGDDAAEENDKKSKDAYWASEDFIKELARQREESKKKVIVSNPPYYSSKDFVEAIAALYGGNYTIHIVG
jgi:hypothetical protein